MSTITVKIDLKQIESAIGQLNPQEKLKLIENLEKETWPDRFKALLKKLDQKNNKHHLSEQEINQACKEVRHKPHVYRRS